MDSEAAPEMRMSPLFDRDRLLRDIAWLMKFIRRSGASAASPKSKITISEPNGALVLSATDGNVTLNARIGPSPQPLFDIEYQVDPAQLQAAVREAKPSTWGRGKASESDGKRVRLCLTRRFGWQVAGADWPLLATENPQRWYNPRDSCSEDITPGRFPRLASLAAVGDVCVRGTRLSATDRVRRIEVDTMDLGQASIPRAAAEAAVSCAVDRRVGNQLLCRGGRTIEWSSWPILLFPEDRPDKPPELAPDSPWRETPLAWVEVRARAIMDLWREVMKSKRIVQTASLCLLAPEEQNFATLCTEGQGWFEIEGDVMRYRRIQVASCDWAKAPGAATEIQIPFRQLRDAVIATRTRDVRIGWWDATMPVRVDQVGEARDGAVARTWIMPIAQDPPPPPPPLQPGEEMTAYRALQLFRYASSDRPGFHAEEVPDAGV